LEYEEKSQRKLLFDPHLETNSWLFSGMNSHVPNYILERTMAGIEKFEKEKGR